MIDATASLLAAEQISAAALVKYLRADGWTSRPSRVEGISIFSKSISGADNPVQFILPVEPRFSDEKRRVADALRTLAQIKGDSEARIARRVQQLASKRKPNVWSAQSTAEETDARHLENKKSPAVFIHGMMADFRVGNDIEKIAQHVRASFGLSGQKAFNIIDVLENAMPKAVDGFRLVIVTKNDAQAIYSTKVPPRIYAREFVYHLAREGDAGSRLLLAHEMAHFLLHPQSRAFGASGVPKLDKELEAEASKFALSFLMPADAIRNFKSAEAVSRHFQVRPEVAKLRMQYLAAEKRESTTFESRIRQLLPRAVRDLQRRTRVRSKQ